MGRLVGVVLFILFWLGLLAYACNAWSLGY